MFSRLSGSQAQIDVNLKIIVAIQCLKPIAFSGSSPLKGFKCIMSHNHGIWMTYMNILEPPGNGECGTGIRILGDGEFSSIQDRTEPLLVYDQHDSGCYSFCEVQMKVCKSVNSCLSILIHGFLILFVMVIPATLLLRSAVSSLYISQLSQVTTHKNCYF